jgi:outer membrane receptor protein involved in Fe transport
LPSIHELCAAAAVFGWVPAAGLAQPAAEPPETPPAKAAAKTVGEVVVTGQSPRQDRAEIDRRSYSLGKNLQAQSGALADVLRTIPSVDVDLQGNVSLRGDQNVTIMVDGKPSGLFRGAARASAIQGLPADRYERVEVITNPSAADSPEGGAGIINLITKQARKAGGSGSAKIGASDRSQRIASLDGSYNAANFSLSGDLSFRGRDPVLSNKTTEDINVPLAAGVSRASRQVGDYDDRQDSLVARLGANYDLDARTRIGVQFVGVAVQLDEEGDTLTTTQDSDGAQGLFDRLSNARFRAGRHELSASLRRKLGDDQELTAQARADRMALRTRISDRFLSVLPAAPGQFALAASDQTTNTAQLKIDYKNPLEGGELKLGYDGSVTRADLSTLYGVAPTPGVIAADPARSGAFEYRLELNAAYATLQKKFGDLTVLAGLRLENSRTTTAMAGVRHEVDRFQPFPSLHLSYPLGEGRTITASYSRRIDRPKPPQLNPLIVFGDRQHLSSGNPDLRPQETDSFEIAYDAHKGASSVAATLFYREIHKAFTQVVRERGEGVLLFTQDNVGNARRAGLSLAGNRKLSSTVSLNLSGDAYWTEIPASALGFGDARSGYVVSGRGSLIWAPTAEDLFQIDARLSGRTLVPQGVVGSTGLLNLGYRRKLTPSLFALVTMQNVLDSNRQKTRFSSPTFSGRRSVEGVGRTLTVTLTYNFGSGSRKPRDPGFDFGSSAPPPGPQ